MPQKFIRKGDTIDGAERTKWIIEIDERSPNESISPFIFYCGWAYVRNPQIERVFENKVYPEGILPMIPGSWTSLACVLFLFVCFLFTFY